MKTKTFAALATFSCCASTAHADLNVSMTVSPKENLMKGKIFILVAVATLALMLNFSPAHAEARIVGGYDADSGAWPWMVALIYTDGSSYYKGQFCGGSLIKAQWVLTAAHCVYDVKANDFKAVFGLYDLKTDTGTAAVVKKIWVHPNFNVTTLDSDLALLELANPVNVPMVDLSSQVAVSGQDAIAIGWGSTDPAGNQYPNILQQVTVPIVDPRVCKEAHANDTPLSANMICAGYPEGGKDTCSGDSGGPLVVVENGQYVQIGITSWGDSCAGANSYGIYSDLNSVDLRKFIKDTTTVSIDAYTLSISKTGKGTLTSNPAGINCGGSCEASFTNGTRITLTAVAATGYTFAGWSGACTNTTGTCTVTMSADTDVFASFKPSTFILTASKIGNGTVTSDPAGIDCGSDCKEAYPNGTKVTLTAAPAAGYALSGWSGACTNTTGTCTVTLSAAKKVTATFKAVSDSSDLVVTNLSIVPTAPSPNSPFAVSITVKNQGKTTADGGYLDVWTNQAATQPCGAEGNLWMNVGRLAAGMQKTFAFTLRSGGAGEKTLRAAVDSWCETAESNESNNQFTKAYTVN